MSQIKFASETIDGIQISTLTQAGFEGVRAFVALPFETERFISGELPHELPHVMEHVVCSGDGALASGAYRARNNTYGGYSNASTHVTNNGLLTFETQQPSSALHIVDAMFSAIRTPQYDGPLFTSEQQIVRNELLQDMQNPSGQREEQRSLAWGREYRTTQSGLDSLEACTPQVAQNFFGDVVNKENLRIVLTGSPKSVGTMTEAALAAFSDLPEGGRIFSRSNKHLPHPTYHATAPELRQGGSFYSLARSVDVGISFDSPAAQSLVRLCLANFLTLGEAGIHDLSRQLGLSYGMNCNVGYSDNQWSAVVWDNVRTDNIPCEIELLEKRLAEAPQYGLEDFAQQRRMTLGSAALYPDSILEMARHFEITTGPGREHEFYLPTEFRKTVETIEPSMVVDAVHGIASALQHPDFDTAYSYGDKPFSYPSARSSL